MHSTDTLTMFTYHWSLLWSAAQVESLVAESVRLWFWLQEKLKKVDRGRCELPAQMGSYPIPPFFILLGFYIHKLLQIILYSSVVSSNNCVFLSTLSIQNELLCFFWVSLLVCQKIKTRINKRSQERVSLYLRAWLNVLILENLLYMMIISEKPLLYALPFFPSFSCLF